jgi:hypothetical protein
MAAKIPTNGLGVDAGLAITDGDLTFASGHGISFAATSDAGGMASELLDDYEEGTFTPSLRTSVNTAGAATAVGSYRKVGSIVTFGAYIICNNATSFDGVSSRSLRTSLPFTAKNTTNLYQGNLTISYYYLCSLTSGYYGLSAYTVPNEDVNRIQMEGNGGIAGFTEGNMNNDGFQIMYGGSYIAE